MRKMGALTIKRRVTLFCLILKKSATTRRAERRAVSPLEMEATTMPRVAMVPPITPSHSLEMPKATAAAEKAFPSAPMMPLS